MSFLVGVIWFIVILILIYAFFGIFAFIPYFFWVLYNFFSFPLSLVSNYIYPVSPFVYTFLIAWITLIFVLWIFGLFKKHD